MELPNDFDVIVVGTGMPECIVAAAVARVGKTVLHLDRKAYYGGDWSSFSYDKFIEWKNGILEQSSQENTEILSEFSSQPVPVLHDEENLVLCPSHCESITNLSFKAYIKEDHDPPAESVSESSPIIAPDTTPPEIVVPENEAQSIPVEEESERTETDVPAEGAVANETGESSSSQKVNVQLSQLEWTLNSFMENRRKFNIDLAPKIMFSRGSLVELLISSNIARYAEFQCINRVLTVINNHIEQVPCSRADVFSTKNVSVVEKRMLMKFLNFCLKYEEQTEEFKDFEDKPFTEFLRSKKLTTNVEHYILNAIAMADTSCNTLQGLQSTQKFLQSLGRYGPSPFLCTCYGSAELPQCFCRLCAVFEGLYYLKRNVESVVFKDGVCTGIITMNQRIGCQHLIMESSYAPSEFYLRNSSPLSISRAILITDSSLYPSEKRENTLMRLPPSFGIENPVTIIELSSKNYVCPEDLNLVYMYCRSFSDTAEEDLTPAVKMLFSFPDQDPGEEKQNHKPNVLWRTFYNQRDTSTLNLNADTPAGLYLTSSPDTELDYEHAVQEARRIFEQICPGEEFLPRAPDPEDIVVENNPGEKIENDVSEEQKMEEECSTDGPSRRDYV